MNTLLTIVEFILIFLASIAVLVFVCSEISINTKKEQGSDVEIYILTNGVHTDIVLPIKSINHDWSNFISSSNTKHPEINYDLVSFGWGDKGFYLKTPTWAELKFSTAFKAMFGLSATAMHVSYYKELQESENCKKILVSNATLQKLIAEIKKSFAQSKPIAIPNAYYSNNDCFYDAVGTYHLFQTCNTWTNTTLKKSGLPACLWTAFDRGIFRKYD